MTEEKRDIINRAITLLIGTQILLKHLKAKYFHYLLIIILLINQKYQEN